MSYHEALDMEGLIGADTVMGTLRHGVGHAWTGRANFYLHDHDSPLICLHKTVVWQDCTFLCLLLLKTGQKRSLCES